MKWIQTLKNNKFFLPKIMVIEITKICYLNCSFCNKYVSTNSSNKMELPLFKKIINKLDKFGVQSFELTPTIGDPLSVPNIYDFINYVHSKNKKCFFFTSLVTKTFDKNFLNKIINYSKDNFYMVISIYGLTKSHFIEETNSTFKQYLIFRKNLDYILKNATGTIIFRNRNYKDTILFEKLCKNYVKDNFKFETESKNMPLKTKNMPLKTRDNVCCNLIINPGIDVYGNIKFCMYADAGKETVIGNIFKTDLNILYTNYFKKILDNPFCNKCGLYDSIENADHNYNNIINTSYTFNSFINKENFNIGLVKLKGIK